MLRVWEIYALENVVFNIAVYGTYKALSAIKARYYMKSCTFSCRFKRSVCGH